MSEVTPASRIPHGTIWSKAPRSQSQLMENPCRVTPRATRMPRAATFRAGPRSSCATQTPLRPSIRTVGRPTSAQTSISMSSVRRTYATTSTGSGSFTIG